MIQIKENSTLLDLHQKAMSKLLISKIDELLEKEFIVISKKRVKLAVRTKGLLEYIKNNIDKFVINGTDNQKALIDGFRMHYPELTKQYKPKKFIPPIYKVIHYLFITYGYGTFTKGFKYNQEEYGAYEFVKLIDLRTCPYCNRNYISTIEKIKGDRTSKKRRPELDHFFPKSIYPFLAVNLYNLIPSCSTCNKLKSDDDSLLLLNPYDFDIDDVKFTYWLNDMKFYDVKSLKDITFDMEKSITIEMDEVPRVNNTVFQLERLYQEHTDVVIELILKYMHYPESYVTELADFGYTKEEVYRFVFSNYLNENNLSKKPLSRLTRDIADELTLLDYFDEIKEE